MSLTLKANTSVFNDSMICIDIWISDEAYRIFQYVVFVFACQSISVFGTGANIINIICFVKQGFHDSANVNFVGLAISDIGCLLTTFLSSIGYNPSFQAMDTPFDSTEMMYLTVGWPHVTFTRATSFITALITLERCLCITIPLKVKSVFTPKIVSMIILAIYGIGICSVVPVYCVNWYTWKFSPVKNRTVLALEFAPGKEKVEFVANGFNMVGPFVAFIIIIICTIILVLKLQNKTQWRMKSIITSQAEEMGNREHKVAKMVVVISIIFISCYLPICLVFMAMMFIPGVTHGGKNIKVAIVIGGIGIFLESVNSSMNLFVYYAMSSKYRAALMKLLRVR